MCTNETRCDLFIIGAGMAGMAAALFAAKRGVATVICGSVGGIDFSSGPLDLLAVHPVAEKKVWDNPWDALDALVADEPQHPYALVGKERIQAAMDEFCDGLALMDLPYVGGAENVRMLTPAGTIKRTFRVPRSMWHGVAALEHKAPTLIVGFKGLKGFSSRQIAEVQKQHWPDLRSVQLPFPRFRGELYVEHLAMSLNDADLVQALALAVKPHLKGAQYVGFPSALGLYGANPIQQTIETLLGAKIFEIPTLPPSLAGLRLRASFEHHLPKMGVTVLSQKMAHSCASLPNGGIRFQIMGQGADNDRTCPESEHSIVAKAAIHAGGRFFGKGLRADRNRITEPLMGLPVHQPESREHWHETDFFSAKGHAVNRSGLETDAMLRALGANGKPVFAGNVFAAGSILAHQDWMRMKCGAGLAIATAYAAVQGVCAHVLEKTAP